MVLQSHIWVLFLKQTTCVMLRQFLCYVKESQAAMLGLMMGGFIFI